MFHLWYLLIMPCHIALQDMPYELMFGHKAPTICNAWHELANCDDGHWRSKNTYKNKQYKLIKSANQYALKNIKQRSKQSVARAGAKPLQIPVGNLVLLRDPLKVKTKFRIITSQTCSSWSPSMRTLMFTLLSQLVTRVWCDRSTDINCLIWKDP